MSKIKNTQAYPKSPKSSTLGKKLDLWKATPHSVEDPDSYILLSTFIVFSPIAAHITMGSGCRCQ